MTIGNAMNFIKRGINDRELRERLNAAASIRGRDEILSAERLQFTTVNLKKPVATCSRHAGRWKRPTSSRSLKGGGSF